MITPDGQYDVCDHPAGCAERVKNHRWGHIKADGWVFLKNGQSFCPNHIPEWYQTWKARKS